MLLRASKLGQKLRLWSESLDLTAHNKDVIFPEFYITLNHSKIVAQYTIKSVTNAWLIEVYSRGLFRQSGVIQRYHQSE